MATTTTARAPNIVLILADDLGIGDVGAYGGQVISTPHIDALAATGVRAAAGYVSHSVCSPSRAGLLTGRHQARHGWEFNPAGRSRDIGMSTAESTFADALRDLGYATGMVGKWHLGSKREYLPMSRGFDEFFGVTSGRSIYIDPHAPGTESEVVPKAKQHRFPTVYRGFERVEARQVYAEPVSSLDLLATFTGAAGKAVTTEDSVNLLPYLRGERDGRPHEHLHWRSGPNTAIRDERWKLIRYRRADPAADDFAAAGRPTPPASGGSTYAPSGHVTMLYDLDTDPGETVNLARDHPGVVERLLARHAEWVETLPPGSAILPSMKSSIIEADGETVQLIF